MVYEYIIHPKSQEQIPLSSEKGINILISYIQQQNAIKQKQKVSDKK